MKIDKRIKVVLVIGVVLWLLRACSWDWYYEDIITYYAPIWVTNNKIAFIKDIENKRHDSNYPLYMKMIRVSDGAILTIKDNFYICTLDINSGKKEELAKIQTEWPNKRYPYYPGSIALNSDASKALVSWVERPGAGTKETGFILIDLKTKEQRLFSESGQYATFGSDGTKILYADDGIWTMEVDGNNKNKLTDNIEDTHPLMSPNGKVLVFERRDGGYLLDLNNRKQSMIWQYGFINWAVDSNYIWTARGLIDNQGKVITNYDIVRENKVIPFGPLSPDGSRILSDYYHEYIYIGDLSGKPVINVKAYQENKYGRINRGVKKAIWIE